MKKMIIFCLILCGIFVGDALYKSPWEVNVKSAADSVEKNTYKDSNPILLDNTALIPLETEIFSSEIKKKTSAVCSLKMV